MNYKIWNQEEELLLKSLVGKMSFKNMVKHFEGRTAVGLQSHSRLMNLDSPYVHKVHSKDESFWETPNPLNCYWAGFLAADGYIYEKAGMTQIKLSISILDEQHLARIVEDTKFTGKIVKYSHKSPSSENVSEMVRVSWSSCDKWIHDLKKNFNLCQGKSHVLQGPNLDNDYLKLCFLIGYLDGDGCVHWGKETNEPVIRIACCGLEILKWIKGMVDKDFNASVRAPRNNKINTRENHYIYCLRGMRAAKLFELLSTIDVPKLDRKWKNPEFLTQLELYKLKFPHFFTNEAKVTLGSDGALVSPDFSAIRAQKASFFSDIFPILV